MVSEPLVRGTFLPLLPSCFFFVQRLKDLLLLIFPSQLTATEAVQLNSLALALRRIFLCWLAQFQSLPRSIPAAASSIRTCSCRSASLPTASPCSATYVHHSLLLLQACPRSVAFDDLLTDSASISRGLLRSTISSPTQLQSPAASSQWSPPPALPSVPPQLQFRFPAFNLQHSSPQPHRHLSSCSSSEVQWSPPPACVLQLLPLLLLVRHLLLACSHYFFISNNRICSLNPFYTSSSSTPIAAQLTATESYSVSRSNSCAEFALLPAPACLIQQLLNSNSVSVQFPLSSFIATSCLV
jgi:hypothetical protein